jgi:lipopolysaccharide export system protein LptA
MDYSDATRTAVLTGASSMHLHQPAQGNQPATDLTATWKDRCVATLFASPNNAVKQIDLAGDVDVNHPQLKMKSQGLSLAFKQDAADASKSEIDHITATGAVDCDLSDALHPHRTLKGEKVIVTMAADANGKARPVALVRPAGGVPGAANGNVAAANQNANANPGVAHADAGAADPVANSGAGAAHAPASAPHASTGAANPNSNPDAGAVHANPGVANRNNAVANSNGGAAHANAGAAPPLGAGAAVYPKAIDASGSVVATDGDQSLTADTMSVTLARVAAPAKPAHGAPAANGAPATARETQLQTFHAAGTVVMLSQDGKALADEVSVDQTTGHPTIELRGKPASLTQQGRTITGPLITARPDDGVATVEGPGTLHAVEASAKPITKPDGATTKPAFDRPIDLAWAGGANLDAGHNLITFRDKIEINTADADGTQRKATSDAMTITLKTAPTTQPAKKPAASTPPTDAFKNKIVSAVTLSGNVNVTSTLNSPAGELVKRTLLQAEKLTTHLDDQQQVSSVDIPGPGQALLQDLSPKPAKPGEPPTGGATAVGWTKSFRLDEGAKPIATLTGGVHVHRDTAMGPGPDSVDLIASKVIVTFEPTAKSTVARPAGTKPAAGTPEMAAGIQQIYAVAPVQFKARTYSFTAQALQFTPDNHTVIISGNDRQPVDFFDSEKGTRGQFQQVWYNTDAQMIERSTGVVVEGGK